MKIGISDNRIWKEEHYKRLRSFGFDCYDFKMADTTSLPYTLSDRDFIEYLKNEKRLADEAGITIWQVHGPWRYPTQDSTPEDRAERLEKMARSIEGAAILGAKYWVVHPIMPHGTQDVPLGRAAQTHDRNLEFMSRLLPTAKREGITICLENMPMKEFSLASPTAIADFVDEMGDELFAMCLDTGHTNVCRDWLTPAETIRRYSDKVKVMHVHDNRRQGDDHLPPYFGTIDWTDFTRALTEVNFPGAISLECTVPQALGGELLESTYSLYAKIAKSLGGEK